MWDVEFLQCERSGIRHDVVLEGIKGVVKGTEFFEEFPNVFWCSFETGDIIR